MSEKNQKGKKKKGTNFVRLYGESEVKSPLANNGRLHFRRCHLCSGVSENEDSPVDKCLHCGKPMAPFYFFNDAEVAPLSDFELRHETEGEFRQPLRGFTAQW